MLKSLSIKMSLFIFLITINTFAQTETSLKLLAPNGGDYWTTGAFPRIAWKSTNITVVKIEISYDGGLNWEIISPAAVAVYGYFSNWQLGSTTSNQCLVKISKYDDPSIFDISDSYFRIVSDNTINSIVVLGSSTAAGVGPSKIDSAWVTKYKNYLYERNTTVKVINLAVGGYTTYDIMPTGFIPPPNRPAPKPANNITKALDYNPYAIIINLPSNDVTLGFTIAEQLANYDTILSLAGSHNIPVWVSTTQPRNFTVSQIQKQIEMRDSTYARFGEKAIDFWTEIADSNGRINPIYDSGDGIHLNDKGHAILFSRVVAKNIFEPLVLSVTENKNIFSDFELMQNYPNPFNPKTKIEFSILESGTYSLKIFNILGQEVKSLFDSYFEPGTFTTDFDAQGLTSGLYMYSLFNLNTNLILTKKMLYLK